MKTQFILRQIIILAAIFFNSISYSQDLLWSNTYPMNDASHGNSIQQTTDGGFIVCGSIESEATRKDIYLLKLSAEGDTIWTQVIGGNEDDEGYCVKQGSDGGFIVAGYSGSFGNGNNYDFFLVKVNAVGDIEWTQTNGDILDEGSYSVIPTFDGGYLAVGYTFSEGAGASDIHAVKFDENGNNEWEQNYGGTENETGFGVCQLRDSGFVICGSSNSFTEEENVYLVRIGARGDTLWTRAYRDTNEQRAYSIYACEESGFIVAGKTATGSNGDDMLLMKIYDDGTLIWKKTYGGEGDEVAYDVKETKNYGFALIGHTTSFSETAQDIYVVSTDDWGDLTWEINYGDAYEDEGRGICITQDNYIAFTGTTGGSEASKLINVSVVLPCPFVLPRGIWFGSSWQFNSNLINTALSIDNTQKSMLIDDAGATTLTWGQKMADFIEYCRHTKMHTVVLNRLEDILRIDDPNHTFNNFPLSANGCTCYPNPANGFERGDTLRNRLKRLVSNLHLAGVTNVLAQWLDQTPSVYNIRTSTTGNSCDISACNYSGSYLADEDQRTIDNNLEILDAFVDFNSNLIGFTGEQFDGIMIDYEYFSPNYGDPTSTQVNYHYAYDGFLQWLNWVDACNQEIDPVNNGIKMVQAYMNYICYTDPDIITGTNAISFDVDQDTDTDEDDTKAEFQAIDLKNLNAITLAFTPRDNLPSIDPNDDPTHFLTGTQPNSTNPTLYSLNRHRMIYFGNDAIGINTNIIPWFWSQNSDPSCTTDARLGNYLLGTCYWTTEHYLYEAENIFLDQFKNYNPAIYQGEPSGEFGNVNIYKGFNDFQYGLKDEFLLATTHDASHALRPEDAYRSYYYPAYCAASDRIAGFNSNETMITAQVKKSKNSINRVSPSIRVLPTSFESESTILLSKHFTDGQFAMKVKDVAGRDVTENFSFKPLNSKSELRIQNNINSAGIYTLSIANTNQIKAHCKFVVLK